MFSTSFGIIGSSTYRAGRSANEYALWGAYGTGARPKFEVSAGSAGSRVVGSSGGSVGGVQPMAHTCISGLEFYCYSRNPDDVRFNVSSAGTVWCGIMMSAACENFLVEDCKIGYFGGNGGAAIYFVLGVAHGLIRLRRNILMNTYSVEGAGNSAGINGAGFRHLLMEENVIFESGWHPDVPTAPRGTHSHNIYLFAYPDGGLTPSQAQPPYLSPQHLREGLLAWFLHQSGVALRQQPPHS